MFFTDEIKMIKKLYKSNPLFVEDIMNYHFFKNTLYYYHEIQTNRGYKGLNISQNLNKLFINLKTAIDYNENEGKINFSYKVNPFGFPENVSFPLLFNSIISVSANFNTIDEMFSRFVESKNPLLLNLSTEFEEKHIELSKELFEFLKRKECSIEYDWSIRKIINGNWNYFLLSLNRSVWEKAFDLQTLVKHFAPEKYHIDRIDQSKIT